MTVRGTFTPFNFQPRFYIDPATLSKMKPNRAAAAAVADVNVKKAVEDDSVSLIMSFGKYAGYIKNGLICPYCVFSEGRKRCHAIKRFINISDHSSVT